MTQHPVAIGSTRLIHAQLYIYPHEIIPTTQRTDAAYLDPESAHTLQVTAWIPLLDAKAENGCMQVNKAACAVGWLVAGWVVW